MDSKRTKQREKQVKKNKGGGFWRILIEITDNKAYYEGKLLHRIAVSKSRIQQEREVTPLSRLSIWRIERGQVLITSRTDTSQESWLEALEKAQCTHRASRTQQGGISQGANVTSRGRSWLGVALVGQHSLIGTNSETRIVCYGHELCEKCIPPPQKVCVTKIRTGHAVFTWPSSQKSLLIIWFGQMCNLLPLWCQQVPLFLKIKVGKWFCP